MKEIQQGLGRATKKKVELFSFSSGAQWPMVDKTDAESSNKV